MASSSSLTTLRQRHLMLSDVWTGLIMSVVITVVRQPTYVSAGCGPDFCAGMICRYGRAYDSDGCVVCDCVYPCEDVQCPANQVCQPVRVSGCDGIRCPLYTGVCAGVTTTTTTARPCPSVMCSSATFCRFGFKTVDGCPSCACVDPCESWKCPAGYSCRMTADDCPPLSECRDAPMPYCAPDAQSPVISDSTTVESMLSGSSSTPTTTRSPSTPSTSTTSSTSTLVVSSSLPSSATVISESASISSRVTASSPRSSSVTTEVVTTTRPSSIASTIVIASSSVTSQRPQSVDSSETAPTLMPDGSKSDTSRMRSPTMASSVATDSSLRSTISSASSTSSSSGSTASTTVSSTTTTATTSASASSDTVAAVATPTSSSNPRELSPSTETSSTFDGSSDVPTTLSSSLGLDLTTQLPTVGRETVSTSLSTLDDSLSDGTSTAGSHATAVDSADGVIHIEASFSIIDNRDDFRRQMQEQIASKLDVSDEFIKVTGLMPGSIVVFFTVIVPPAMQSDTVERHLLAWLTEDVNVTYNGNTYQSRLVNYTVYRDFVDDVVTPSTDAHSATLLIAFVCVLVPAAIIGVVFVLIVIWRSARSKKWVTFPKESSTINSSSSSKVEISKPTAVPDRDLVQRYDVASEMFLIELIYFLVPFENPMQFCIRVTSGGSGLPRASPLPSIRSL